MAGMVYGGSLARAVARVKVYCPAGTGNKLLQKTGRALFVAEGIALV
jgi:hypothetical protein